MAHRTDSPRKDTEASTAAPESQCLLCRNPDPQIRTSHHLTQAHLGVEVLRQHLHRFYAQETDTDRRKRLIDDLCYWIAGEIDIYKGYADPRTGATLPWWEAREQAHTMTATHQYEEVKPEAAWRRSADTVRLPATAIKDILVEAFGRVVKDPWAEGHLLLMETGVNRRGREREAATVCRQCARQWPQDAEAWEREAQWWEQGAVGVCTFDRIPGEEG